MVTKELNITENFNDMLVSVLLHDLRQPFATFIMVADMIKHTKHVFSENELLMIFEDMQCTASKSIELMDGLLYWMKSKNAGAGFSLQPLPLYAMINEANSLQLYDQQVKSIKLCNDVPEFQIIYACKEMLQFINRNILNNATKYSPLGGTINVTSSVENGWITIAFTDQGKGVTVDELINLFNRHEGTNLSDFQLKGAGVALSICKEMIRKMNGKIWAESVPGEGSTFYYALPVLNTEL